MVTFVLYVLYLIFTFRSPEGSTASGEGHAPFSRRASFVLLVGATAAVAYVSEAFVGP